MPGVRGLHDYVAARGLAQTAPLALLKGCRVGLELAAFMHRIDLVDGEPYSAALGGEPLTMRLVVRGALQPWLQAGIQPVFFLPGLALPPPSDEPDAPPRISQAGTHRSNAWEAVARGDHAKVEALFRSASGSVPPRYTRRVVEELERCGASCKRAPYLPLPQAVQDVSGNPALLDYVMSPSLEALMYAAQVVIIDVNWDARTYSYVELAVLLRDIKLSLSQFIDACVLASNDLGVGFDATFRSAVIQVQQLRKGYLAALTAASKRPLLPGRFARARTIVRHCPVLGPDGIVAPRASATAPSDLAAVIGPRLPNDVFYLLSRGVFTPGTLKGLVTGTIFDPPAFVDTHEYRRVLQMLHPVRGRTLAVLTSRLHPQLAGAVVHVTRWFEPMMRYPLEHGVPPLPPSAKWSVSQQGIDHALSKLGSRSIGLASALRVRLLQRDADTNAVGNGGGDSGGSNGIGNGVAGSNAGGKANEVTQTQTELHYLVLLQFLQLHDFLGDDQFTPTRWGDALTCSRAESRDQAMFWLLYLLRFQIALSLPLHPIRSSEQAPPPAPGTAAAVIRLCSRVLTLMPLHCSETPWRGRICYDLAALCSLVQCINDVLRAGVEMIHVSLFLKTRARMPLPQHVALSRALPFGVEASAAMGLVATAVLDGSCNSMAELARVFPNATHLADDLSNASAFWTDVMSAVELLGAAAASGVTSAVLPTPMLLAFREADKLWQTRILAFLPAAATASGP